MTQPLVDPGAAFLAQDPVSAFLSGGRLEDNLPTESPVPSHHTLAVGLAAAFLGWAMLSSRALRSSVPPASDDQADRTVRRVSLWMDLSKPVLATSYRQTMPADTAAVAAAEYAASMGEYLHATSTAAMLAGYRAELGAGVSVPIAWQRAATGFGLDARAMRSWILAQRKEDQLYAQEVVSPGAAKALDRALMARADALGQNEGWAAQQTGQTLLWIEQQAKGELNARGKRWVTKDDELVCPVCGPLHLVVVDLDAQFELPDGNKIWAPGVHPNCRCTLELVDQAPMQELLEKKLPKLVAKAMYGDRYDRDKYGHFAAKETRRPAPRVQVLDRPEVEAEPVAEPATAEPITEPEVGVNPFASVGVNPFASTAANPFEALAVNPFESAGVNPFEAAAVNPFESAKPGAGGGKIIIIRRDGSIEEVEDAAIFAPVDVYHRAFDYADADTTMTGDGEFGPDDVGKIVDFDLWQKRTAASNADRDLPGFPAEVLPTDKGQAPLMDKVHASLEYSSDDAWNSNYTDFYEQRENAIEHLREDYYGQIQYLSEGDLRQIFANVGRKTEANNASAATLRDTLLAAVEGSEEEDEWELEQAWVEHEMEDNDANFHLESSQVIAGSVDFEVPQLFSFPANVAADRIAGSNQLLLRGKYRVESVKMHGYRKNSSRTQQHSQTGKRFFVPEHPQVKQWREIKLVPVEE